jgi:hypothetical protein
VHLEEHVSSQNTLRARARKGFTNTVHFFTILTGHHASLSQGHLASPSADRHSPAAVGKAAYNSLKMPRDTTHLPVFWPRWTRLTTVHRMDGARGLLHHKEERWRLTQNGTPLLYTAGLLP